MKSYYTILIALITSIVQIDGQENLFVKQTISNNAVLQRNVEIPISGRAKNVGQVLVRFGDKKLISFVNKKGEWRTKLPPTAAGGPHSIQVITALDTLTFSNIFFGDVWLCSGQSNMAWVLANTNNAEEEIQNNSDTLIRHFKVPIANADSPQNELPGGNWNVARPQTLGSFTAVGYYFGKEIRKSENIPIGLLNSSWGGSRIEPWISKETLDAQHPNYSYSAYAKNNQINLKAERANIEKMFPGLNNTDRGMEDGKPLWAGKRMDKERWKPIKTDKLWENQGFQGIDGIAWYRTSVELDTEQVSADVTINLGAIDDNDQVWINGKKIGETRGYKKERSYVVSSNHLVKGENILLIRVEDTGGGGGLYKSDFKQNITTSTDLIKLSNLDWNIRFSAIQFNTLSNKIPNLIYNAMIHPITDFPITGVIWYQGESNAGDLQTAYDYRHHLETLIKEWRVKWNNPELPFYYVSLANFQAPKEEPSNDGWAVIRESMTEVLKLPYTGQAVIIDIGEEGDIHPRNKKDVGKRLALPALNQVYRKDVVSGSPMYDKQEIEGSKIVITFKNVGNGLAVKDMDTKVQGFSIAGKNQEFHWAEAYLEDGKIKVWSDKVAKPVAVRYAWEINPEKANLYSSDGLPVTPFRTDNWDITEISARKQGIKKPIKKK